MAERDHIIGVRDNRRICPGRMHVGLYRGKIGERALRQIDHILGRTEIVDRLFAETRREHECVGSLAAGQHVASAAN